MPDRGVGVNVNGAGEAAVRNAILSGFRNTARGLPDKKMPALRLARWLEIDPKIQLRVRTLSWTASGSLTGLVGW